MTSTAPRNDDPDSVDGAPDSDPPSGELVEFSAPGLQSISRRARSVRDRQRADVIIRYARLRRSGRPVYCKPSRAELRGDVSRRQGQGTDGKVIYPDRVAAEAAARELEALGSRPMRSYLCKRSRSGHHHLTTDWALTRSTGVPRQRPPAE